MKNKLITKVFLFSILAVFLSASTFAQIPSATAQVDSTPPSLVDARTTDTRAIDVNFSETLDESTVTPSDFTVSSNTVDSVSLIGSIVVLSLGSDLAADATPQVELVGSVSDVAGNVLSGAGPVTASDGIHPTIETATSSSDFIVILNATENLVNNSVLASDFTIDGNLSTPTTVSSVTISGNTITLFLSDVIFLIDGTASVTKIFSETITDVSGNLLLGFVIAIDPVVTETEFTAFTSTTNEIFIFFNKNVDSASDSTSQWSVSDNTVIAVSALDGTSDSLTLTLGTSIKTDATPNVTYTAGDVVDTLGNPLSNATVTATDGIRPEIERPEVYFQNSLSFFFTEDIVDNSVTLSDFTVNGIASNSTVISIGFGPNAVTLGLDNSITTSDTAITLDYSLSSGSIDDLAGNNLASFTGLAFSNGPPLIIDGITRTTTTIEIFYDTDLVDNTVTFDDYAVANNTVIAASEEFGVILLTLGTAIGTGDTPLVTQIGSVTDVIGFTQTSTSFTPFDGLHPLAVSASTLSENEVEIILSELVSNDNATPSDFTVSGVASNPSVTSISVSGSTIVLALSDVIVAGDTTITVSYQQTSGNINDLSNLTEIGEQPKDLDNFGPLSVENTLSSGPTVISAETTSTTSIDIIISEVVFNSGAIPSDFTISGVASNPSVTSILVSGTIITLSLSSEMTNLDTPTVTYVDDATSVPDIHNAADIELDSFGPLSVTNNIPGVAPTVTSAQTTSTTSIELTTSEVVFDNGAAPSDFTISGVASNPSVTSILVSGNIISLSLTSSITNLDTPTVSYVDSTLEFDIENAAGEPLDDFVISVTNTLTSAPTVTSAQTTSTTSIELTTSEVVFDNGAAPSDFTVSGVASLPSVTSILVSGNTISLSLSSNMTNLDTLTVTYVDDSTTDLDIHNAADIELASFTNLFVTNNIPAAPTILSVVVSDPDNADTVYSAGDIFTITMSEATNQSGQVTQAQVDDLFTFSDSIGQTYSGEWISSSVFVITVTNTAGNGITIGSTTISPTGTTQILNAAETSAPSAGVRILTGNFGVVAPGILAIVAEDPDGAPSGYSVGDTITVLFTEPTNQPFKGLTNSLTRGDLLNLFTFSQNLGNDFTGTWRNPSTLIITVVDPTGSTPPAVGVLTLTVKASADLRNSALTSSASTAVSPVLVGDFGAAAGPTISALVANDPDNGPSGYTADDIITVRFSESTNEPFKGDNNLLSRADILELFTFNQDGETADLGADFTATWKNPSTLVITVVDPTGSTPPAVGGLTITILESANLRDADETSLPSTFTSPILTGNFGTFEIRTDIIAGGTASTELPDGNVVTVTDSIADIITISQVLEGELPPDFTLLGTFLDVTATNNSCAVDAGCQVSFTFTQDDLDELEILLSQIRIFLDSNENGDLESDESVTIVIETVSTGSFIATADESFGSKFAIGGVKFLALAGLGGSIDLSPPSFNARVFDEDDHNLNINGNLFKLPNFENQINTQTFDVGEKITMEFIAFEQRGVESLIHFEFLTNLTGIVRDYTSSDTYLIYDKGSEIQVTDPHGLFSETAFSISDDGNIVFITVDLTFAKPMDSSDVIIRMWDEKQQSLDTIINDMIVIVGDEVEISTSSESQVTTGDSSQDGTITETKTSIPEWLKKNAGWWSQGQLDDSTFTNSVQYLIQNQIIDIPMLFNVSVDPDEEDKFAEEEEPVTAVPKWIKNNAGWWSEGQIDDETFVMGIQYLVENGIIIV